MRQLAEFIMRGRWQAMCIALIGSWVPFVSQATLGLVTLRKGWQEGLIITLAAALPSMVGLGFGNVGSAVVMASASVFFVAYVLAVVLRVSVSWPITLMATVGFSMLAGLLVTAAFPGLEKELAEFFKHLFENSAQQDAAVSQQIDAALSHFTRVKASGVVAFWVGISALVGVIIGRWLQAVLYNPGGFQIEFHSLRLTVPVAAVCAAAVVYCGFRGSEYLFWGNLFSVPLVVAGLGLVHFIIAKLSWGTAAVVALYVALFFLNPLALLLMFLGFTDPWINYRAKFKFKR